MEEFEKISDVIESGTKLLLKPDPKVIEALTKIPHKKILSSRRVKEIKKILEVIGLFNMFDLCFAWSGNEDFIHKPKKEAYDYV